MAEAQDVIRDSQYYYDDGDFIIRVDNTLFKLHRFLLKRDDAIFRDMFSLGGNTQGNKSPIDEDVLVLPDDIEDFRALCWVFYALPLEIVAQSLASTMDPLHVARIFRIAHKYNLVSTEKWAAEALLRYSQDDSCTARCSAETLRSIISVAVLISSHTMRAAIEKAWLSRLQSESTSLSIADALDCAAELGLREFQGQLYYNHMVKMNKASQNTSSEACSALLFSESGLRQLQILHLCAGYWSLTKYEEKMMVSDAPPLPDPSQLPTCSSHFACSREWTAGWKSAIDEAWLLGRASTTRNGQIFERLDTMQTHLHKHAYRIPTPRCREAALSHIPAIKQKLTTTLSDYFLGPKQA